MKEFPKRISHLVFIFSLMIPSISAANDTLNRNSILRDGETLVSSGGMFELGFFNPESSTNRYLGIWYSNISVRTYFWVANRETPLTTNLGVLRVTETGNLALLNGTNGTIIWSSNATSSTRNASAQLLDTGNLVVKDADDDSPDNFIWQSFDHPTDTYGPGMITLGWNYVTGVETYMSSWRSDDDPSPGEITLHLDPTGYPQLIMKRGEAVQYREGPWNGIQFSGSPAGNVINPILRMTRNEIKFGFEGVDKSLVFRATLSPNGVVVRTTLNQRTRTWTNSRNTPEGGSCDTYDLCGPNGICNISGSPICKCLDKFVPRDPQAWTATDWLTGCERRIPFDCQGDVFLNYSGIQLPDSRNSSINEGSTSLAECEEQCSRNCSCIAYTQLNISGAGSGCLFYHGDLIDVKAVSSGAQNLYIRMASAERVNVGGSKGKKGVILIASLTSMAGILLVCFSLIIFCTRKRRREKNVTENGPFSASHGEETELQFLNLSTILKATDNFSNDNKLGEGGFGPVFKGILEDGQEIAVKRLSKNSFQGVDELKNEVLLIAKLQHRNLVRLLGCCTQGEENMLIYEYMPNHSLDLILFDQNRSSLLDWEKRFWIVNGIAKGLLYLHQDSRLRIIHRDLKASNILLDAEMNPKISDFGMARSFGGNETEAETRRIVGTYGYMSPEYAMDGLFSIKSDVFSFGVLVLEVVSGKRNRRFSLQNHNLNLIEHAWALYKDDMLFKLVDTSLGDSFDWSEVFRSIHVALMCVQRLPEDRPNMSSVVFMLANDAELPEIKSPGFFTEADGFFSQISSNTSGAHSTNQITVTMPEGR